MRDVSGWLETGNEPLLFLVLAMALLLLEILIGIVPLLRRR